VVAQEGQRQILGQGGEAIVAALPSSNLMRLGKRREGAFWAERMSITSIAPAMIRSCNVLPSHPAYRRGAWDADGQARPAHVVDPVDADALRPRAGKVQVTRMPSASATISGR